MKRRALLVYLRRHGCEQLREGSGHSWWWNPGLNMRSAVPRHTEIDDLLAKKICKDLGGSTDQVTGLRKSRIPSPSDPICRERRLLAGSWPKRSALERPRSRWERRLLAGSWLKRSALERPRSRWERRLPAGSWAKRSA